MVVFLEGLVFRAKSRTSDAGISSKSAMAFVLVGAVNMVNRAGSAVFGSGFWPSCVPYTTSMGRNLETGSATELTSAGSHPVAHPSAIPAPLSHLPAPSRVAFHRRI